MSEKLGQNFLVNKSVARKIVQAANLTRGDLVLEIGAGRGILTEELAKVAGKVMAVEIDKNLVNLLRSKLQNNEYVEIINQDVLKISNSPNYSNSTNKIPNSKSQALNKFRNTKYQIPDTKYKVVSNLPYYITSPVIRKFLEAEFPPSVMILMIQKEVAERIVGKPGKMSILAVAVQYYARPEILFHVDRGNFEPVPEVDSAVIKITRNKNQETRDKNNNKFFQVVRAGFCAKRKTLANNLANSFHKDRKEVEEILARAGLSEKVRAQELSVEDWKKLASLFKEK